MNHHPRTAVITGANSGIGRRVAMSLGIRGWHVVLACRSAQSAQIVADEIRSRGGSASIVELDLASLSSVRDAAATILRQEQRIDVLINNAGVAGHHGRTKDGFEIHFGVNYLGHYLFTELLLGLIIRSSPSRIINVSSESHREARVFDLSAVQSPTRSLTGLREYELSKLCMVLHTLILRERLHDTGVVATSLHPGKVATLAWRRIPQPFRSLATMFMLSDQKGAEYVLHCALDEGLWSKSELYYDQGSPRAASRLATDTHYARELWAASVLWVS